MIIFKFKDYFINESKEDNLDDLEYLIHGIKDELDIQRVDFLKAVHSHPHKEGENGFYSWEESPFVDMVTIIIDFNQDFYNKNKEKIIDLIGEFEDRLEDFEFKIDGKTSRVNRIYKMHEDERKQQGTRESYFVYKVYPLEASFKWNHNVVM